MQEMVSTPQGVPKKIKKAERDNRIFRSECEFFAKDLGKAVKGFDRIFISVSKLPKKFAGPAREFETQKESKGFAKSDEKQRRTYKKSSSRVSPRLLRHKRTRGNFVRSATNPQIELPNGWKQSAPSKMELAIPIPVPPGIHGVISGTLAGHSADWPRNGCFP
jgi:hypothetical protein